MSKTNRGSGLRDQVRSGRGKCPQCGRTGIKVVYEVEKDGAKLNICKQCKATLANQKESA